MAAERRFFFSVMQIYFIAPIFCHLCLQLDEDETRDKAEPLGFRNFTSIPLKNIESFSFFNLIFSQEWKARKKQSEHTFKMIMLQVERVVSL